MSYSEDLRKKVIEYLNSGYTQREARDTFHISLSAINRWSQQYHKTGELKNKPLNRSFKKLDPEKLKAYVKEHPDAYQQEMAERFGCSRQAVQKALKKLGITRKKTKRYREQRAEQVAKYLEQIAHIPTSQIAYVDRLVLITICIGNMGGLKKGLRWSER